MPQKGTSRNNRLIRCNISYKEFGFFLYQSNIFGTDVIQLQTTSKAKNIIVEKFPLFILQALYKEKTIPFTMPFSKVNSELKLDSLFP